MKKTLTLLTTCFAVATAIAQPQLTSSEMMSIGTTFKMKVATNESIIDTTIQGADVVWDFTNLTPDNSEDDMVFEVVSPQSTPAGNQFPNANFAFKETPDVAYRYFNLSSTKMERVGSYSTSANQYSDPQIEYVFPLALGVSNKDTWESTNSSFGGTYDLKCVGWGKLKLPGITHDSVLMVEVKMEELFELTSYFWYSSKNGMPLLQYVIGDGFFVPTFAQYTYSTILTSGIGETSKLHLGISYTNPVEDVLTLNFVEDTQPLLYTVVNLMGQTVLSGSMNEIRKNQSISIDMQGLDAGIYFLNMSNQSSGEMQSVKLLKK